MSDLFQQNAAEQLAKIAERMEGLEPDDPFRKELQKEYKYYLELSGIKKEVQGHGFSSQKITASRKKSLVEVIKALKNLEEFEKKCDENRTGLTEYIAISTLANYKGMPCEINLEISATFAADVLGHKCYKARKNLFMQNVIKTYPTIEYGLLDYGM